MGGRTEKLACGAGEGVRPCDAVVELDDNESTCHALLADICMQRRSFDLAVRHARRAVEINPNNQWNAADLGSILLYVGEPEEALSCFSKAREIDPYFEEPWYWRVAGLAYMSLQSYPDALTMLNRARARAPTYAALTAGVMPSSATRILPRRALSSVCP